MLPSITRQSTLPPKNPKEEAKHRKEHEEMLRAFSEKLKQEEARRQAEIMRQARLEQIKLVQLAQWRREFPSVLDNWSVRCKEKHIRNLVWTGVPPSLRGNVWFVAVRNSLNITPELFQIYVERAKAVKEKTDTEMCGKENTLRLIPLDLQRTFPMLAFFQEDGPCHQPLQHLLEAFVVLRPDLGYVQGMSFIAAVFLLNMDSYEAFVCFANVLNRKLFLSFFRMDLEQLTIYLDLLNECILEVAPKTYAHLKRLGIHLNTFAVDWFLTLFSKSLPLELAARIWDVYFLVGDVFLFRAAAGILSHLEPLLLTGDFEVTLTTLTKLPRDRLDADQLMEHIRHTRLSEELEQRIDIHVSLAT